MTGNSNWHYPAVKEILNSETPPCVLVNRTILNANIRRLGNVAEDANKTLRVASKSVRVPSVLRCIRRELGQTFGGLMTYSPEETLFLHEQGFSDFLLAYPRVDRSQLAKLLTLSSHEVKLRVMVDEPAHLEAIKRARRSLDSTVGPLPVCIDLDVSYRPGDLTHLGVLRSPVRTVAEFKSFYRTVRNHDAVTFAGVMGYEAQQAGVPDDSPYQPVKNHPIRLMKLLSRRAVARKRRKIAEFLEGEGVSFIFNAGGTGSIHDSVREDWITEVTAGSGFLQPHLFDYYRSNRNEPAFCYALPVTRKPEPNVVTCQGGGFVASGPTGEDKAPRPFRPQALETVSTEGFGEVQTPIRLPEDVTVKVGDPLLFRPAKAGELAERFDEYIILDENDTVECADTYRGHGRCFH